MFGPGQVLTNSSPTRKHELKSGPKTRVQVKQRKKGGMLESNKIVSKKQPQKSDTKPKRSWTHRSDIIQRILQNPLHK